MELIEGERRVLFELDALCDERERTRVVVVVVVVVSVLVLENDDALEDRNDSDPSQPPFAATAWGGERMAEGGLVGMVTLRVVFGGALGAGGNDGSSSSRSAILAIDGLSRSHGFFLGGDASLRLIFGLSTTLVATHSGLVLCCGCDRYLPSSGVRFMVRRETKN